jgi:hypothetical protein
METKTPPVRKKSIIDEVAIYICIDNSYELNEHTTIEDVLEFTT